MKIYLQSGRERISKNDFGEARSHRSTTASSFCGIREKVIAVEAIEERELTGIARRESFPKFCRKRRRLSNH